MPSLLDQLYLCRANLDAAKRRVAVLEAEMDELLSHFSRTLDPLGE